MHVAEQFTLDLAGERLETRLQAQWAANRAERASRRHEDDYAMYWCGIQDRDVWLDLPGYERDRIKRMYQMEQDHLAWRINVWEEMGGYWCEKFYPDGTSERWPRRPFRIPDFKEVEIRPDPKRMAQEEAAAQAMADQLTGDWSAGRPASVTTCNPFMAMRVSAILGKKVVSVMPEDRWGVPIAWQFIHYWLYPEEASNSQKPCKKRSRLPSTAATDAPGTTTPDAQAGDSSAHSRPAAEDTSNAGTVTTSAPASQSGAL